MTTPFPSPAGPEREAGTEPQGTRRTTPYADRRASRRDAWPLIAAMALIVAGAVLLWIVGGTVAGIDTDTIGVAALVVGAIALLARAVTMRRSRRDDAPLAP